MGLADSIKNIGVDHVAARHLFVLLDGESPHHWRLLKKPDPIQIDSRPRKNVATGTERKNSTMRTTNSGKSSPLNCSDISFASVSGEPLWFGAPLCLLIAEKGKQGHPDRLTRGCTRKFQA
jgi:hypothetical protein